jgi:ADP-ribosylglycohydrolase
VTDEHDGCGAAVRVSPVGILFTSRRLEDLVGGAREASVPTHGGPFALAAATATAAAVSAALDGAAPHGIIALAQLAARRAESERSGSPDGEFAEAIGTIHADLSQRAELHADEVAGKHFPNTPLTIVPLAIALATVMSSAEAAILLAANIGGDSDSVASIAGSILGARRPGTINETWYAVVETINDHRLIALGEHLASMRR